MNKALRTGSLHSNPLVRMYTDFVTNHEDTNLAELAHICNSCVVAGYYLYNYSYDPVRAIKSDALTKNIIPTKKYLQALMLIKKSVGR